MREKSGRTGLLAAITLVALLAGTAAAGPVVVLPRPGQVGLSVGGSYGLLLKSGEIGNQFGSGPGMNVRLRYRARYERGWGLTFESHSLDLRDLATVDDYWTDVDDRYPADSSVAYKKATMFLYGVDFYQMFGTRTRTTTMLSVGAGLAHPAFTLNDGETQFPIGDGPYLAAGAGVERFFWRSLAFDLGARYAAIFVGDKVHHDLHASIGLIYYASL
jgi:hypothetical protein